MFLYRIPHTSSTLSPLCNFHFFFSTPQTAFFNYLESLQFCFSILLPTYYDLWANMTQMSCSHVVSLLSCANPYQFAQLYLFLQLYWISWRLASNSAQSSQAHRNGKDNPIIQVTECSTVPKVNSIINNHHRFLFGFWNYIRSLLEGMWGWRGRLAILKRNPQLCSVIGMASSFVSLNVEPIIYI